MGVNDSPLLHSAYILHTTVKMVMVWVLIKVPPHTPQTYKCMNDIQDSEYYPKLRTYKTFKLYFKQEICLSEIKDYRYIIALARFRISSHYLKIETGRYSKSKLEVNLRK